MNRTPQHPSLRAPVQTGNRPNRRTSALRAAYHRGASAIGNPHALHTSGDAFPFVRNRLSDTPARLQQPSRPPPDLSRVRPS